MSQLPAVSWPREISCERFVLWAQNQGIRIAGRQPIRRRFDRAVWRCHVSDSKECLYLKVGRNRSLRFGSEPIPETVLESFSERLFACAECGLSLDRTVPGASLDRTDFKEMELVYSAAGTGLATFHNLSRVGDETISPKKFIEKLIGRVAWIRSQGETLDTLPDLPGLRKSLLKRFPEPLPQSWIHGDLKPEHVFILGDQVRFIDRDALKKGFSLLDPANLVDHLEWLLADHRERPVHLFLKAYEEGFSQFDPWMFRLARFLSAIRTIRNRVAEFGDEIGETLKAPQQTLVSVWLEIDS